MSAVETLRRAAVRLSEVVRSENRDRLLEGLDALIATEDVVYDVCESPLVRMLFPRVRRVAPLVPELYRTARALRVALRHGDELIDQRRAAVSDVLDAVLRAVR